MAGRNAEWHESMLSQYLSFECLVHLIILQFVFQINYKADKNQIGFLQLLSVTAAQNITYHCKNSVAYFDLISRTYTKGLKLLSWNDVELLPRGNARLRYSVSEDDCRVKTHNTKT